MGRTLWQRIFASIAVIAVVLLAVFGVRHLMSGPNDRDLGDGFTFEQVEPSPTSRTPQSPDSASTEHPSATAEPSGEPDTTQSTDSPSEPPSVQGSSSSKKTVDPLPPSQNQHYDDDDDDDGDDDDDDDGDDDD